MPIMGGKELLPYLAENYPEMPLIVISGYRDFDYVKQAISAAAIDYILKPFSKEAIQNCVCRATNAWKTARLSQESPIVMKKKKQPTTNMISSI